MKLLNRLSIKKSFGARFVFVIMAVLIVIFTLDKFIVISKFRNAMSSLTESYMKDFAEAYESSLEFASSTLGYNRVINANVLTAMLGGVTCEGIDESYCYVVSKDNTMLYHKTTEKIGKPVENATVLEVCEKLRNGEKVESFVATYEYHGEIQYAAIVPSSDGSFVLVAAASKTIAMQPVDSIRNECIGLNFILLFITLVILIVMTVKVVNPLIKAAEDAKKLEKLDFRATESIAKIAKRHDEVGQIGKAVVGIQGELSTAISDVKDQSANLYRESEKIKTQTDEANEAVEQVKNAIKEIASTATSQAQDTQEATSRVIKMGEAVQMTTEEVGELFESTQAVGKSGDEAVETLTELEKITQTATSAIDNIFNQTNATNESVLKIHDATALITAIAEETNLLSLNASIEAARAGEQGRGFAVVAAQIQKLAEQSNASAGKIEEIIDKLIEESNKSVETMGEVKNIMQTQSEQIQKTESIIKEVKERINEAVDNVNTIENSTKNIEQARKEITDIISNLSAIAEENAANTEETSASATLVGEAMTECTKNVANVQEIAKTLDESMNKFVI